MIFDQILSTNSIRQCIDTSVENLYLDIGLKGLNNKVNSLQQGHLGIGTKCPSKIDVRLIESQIRGVKKGRDPGSIKVSEKLPT